MIIKWWQDRRRCNLNALSDLVLGQEKDLRLGLTFSKTGKFGWYLMYTVHGFGYWWLPTKVSSLIATRWNRIVCLFKGHQEYPIAPLGVVTCAACCKEWKEE